MISWLNKDAKRQQQAKAFGSVTEGLQRSYKDKLWPVEKEHDFWSFYSPELTDADFAAKPMVLMMGQYSTGKSTFIRHLLGRDYPGLRIGPEPTTDKFVAVLHGEQDQIIPGNAVVIDPSLPFTQLSHFGNAFLSKFECARLPSPVLEGITLIDSPGVLSGEKQRLKRGYEFEHVVKWYADRVDMILLLFDVSKLDISDEFRRVILAVKGNDQKVHVILNKADRVTTQQLMRVYGALLWSLGKVLDTPEVSRVYVGSFWDEPLQNDEQRKLFEQESDDLYTQLAQLPRGAAIRKVNDLIKRARLAKVHACIMDSLRRQMPKMMGKAKKQQELIATLPDVFRAIAKEKNLPLGDFPDPKLMQEKLSSLDFTTFKKIDQKKMDNLESMLTLDIPELLKLVPEEQSHIDVAKMDQMSSEASPFAVMQVGGASASHFGANQWLERPEKEQYRAEFESLGPNADGKITGQKAKTKLIESKLPSNVLHRVWNLADVDKDGCLDLYEFALAKHLMAMKFDGKDLPAELPASLAPP